jgi:NAD(P)H dehydrogenase (quinone)
MRTAPLHVLLVLAHPDPHSFNHACAAAAIAGLEGAGHSVDTIDLCAEHFTAAMTLTERLAYDTDQPIVDPQVADHAARLKRCDALVFVYPTWWSGLPAVLKGWLERVMVPGVSFEFDPVSGKVRPALQHVRRIVGISTYGSPRRNVRLINDNGRRIITRALRLNCGWRARTTWLGLYAIDTATDADRRAFLNRVESTLAGLR